MRDENVGDAVVFDVEIDGLDSVVTVDVPEFLRSKLRYSYAVRVENKISFKLLVRIDDDDDDDDDRENCNGDHNKDSDEGKEEGDGNLGEDDSGSEDQCGNVPSSGPKDFEGSFGKVDEECEEPCPESGFSEEDGKVPCNDNVKDDDRENLRPGSWPGSGENSKRADDCFKEETFQEECKASDLNEDSTFRNEQSHDEPFFRSYWDNVDDEQYDYMSSFDDERSAEFFSDFRYCNGAHSGGSSEMKEEGSENSGEHTSCDSPGIDKEAKSSENDCGNDPSGSYKDFKGSYRKVDNNLSGKSEQKDDPKNADDCFKGEAFAEDPNSVPEEFQTPDLNEPSLQSKRKDAADSNHYDYTSSFDEGQSDVLFQPSRTNPSNATTPEDYCHVVQDDIINERERLKQSDGYKRADQAEWAARLQEILNQAEEARRLRDRRKLEASEAKKKAQEEERQLKRKKAQQLRAANLQKRQKQRVEEFKEAAKKDEEDVNAKERIRAEARKKISQLKSKCKDFPSLLRILGAGLASRSKPSPEEVRKAYRRAVLKFHPDHASKAGIEQQVVAEETFKLITQMNEKYVNDVKGG